MKREAAIARCKELFPRYAELLGAGEQRFLEMEESDLAYFILYMSFYKLFFVPLSDIEDVNIAEYVDALFQTATQEFEFLTPYFENNEQFFTELKQGTQSLWEYVQESNDQNNDTLFDFCLSNASLYIQQFPLRIFTD